MNNRLNESCIARQVRHDRLGIHFLLPRLLAALLGVALLAPSLPAAQVAPAKVAPALDRCLFIVETSKAMQRRQDAVLAAVQDLLTSGLNGLFHEGGTVGIWTYNADLATGQFPLEMWSNARRKAITDRAWAFLKGQEYQKEGDFSKVMPALGRVIQESELLTVVVFNSGEHGISGTPYDRQINQSFHRWRDMQDKSRAPFVTVLRVRKGRFAAYAVNTPPWPFQMPYLADEIKSGDSLHEKLAHALHGSSTSSVSPQTVSAKPAAPEPAPIPKPEPAVLVTAPSASPAEVYVTNLTTAPKPAELPILPAELTKPEPVPALAEKPAAQPSPTPAPAPQPPPEAKPEVAKTPAPQTNAPAPVQPAPAPPAAQQAAAPLAAQAFLTATSTTNAAPAASAASSSPGPSAAEAFTVPIETATTTKNIWTVAIILTVGFILMALLLRRRRRRVPLGSLITEAIEREKGQ